MRATKIIAWSVAAAALLVGSQSTFAQQAGHFTQEQADKGANDYAAQCAACHGADLEGTIAPALVGADTMQSWATAGGIYGYFAVAMPPNAPGTLDKETYVNILAHILSKNGFTAGSEALTDDPAVLDKISLVAAAAPAAPAAAAAPAAPAAAAPAAPAAAAPAPAAPGAVPQAFTFGKELPSVEAPAAAPAKPTVPQAFTFGKELPTVPATK